MVINTGKEGPESITTPEQEDEELGRGTEVSTMTSLFQVVRGVVCLDG